VRSIVGGRTVGAAAGSRLTALVHRWLPERAAKVLAINAFVGTVGTGLFLTGAVVYYTRVIGLSTQQVGAGLAAAQDGAGGEHCSIHHPITLK